MKWSRNWFFYPIARTIMKGCASHIMDWPKASISRARRLVLKSFSLIVLIRLSSSPPGTLSHHLKAIEKLISLWNSQVVSLMPKKYTATKVHLFDSEGQQLDTCYEKRFCVWKQYLKEDQWTGHKYCRLASRVGRASAVKQFLKTKKLSERNPRHTYFSVAQRG